MGNLCWSLPAPFCPFTTTTHAAASSSGQMKDQGIRKLVPPPCFTLGTMVPKKLIAISNESDGARQALAVLSFASHEYFGGLKSFHARWLPLVVPQNNDISLPRNADKLVYISSDYYGMWNMGPAVTHDLMAWLGSSRLEYLMIPMWESSRVSWVVFFGASGRLSSVPKKPLPRRLVYIRVPFQPLSLASDKFI